MFILRSFEGLLMNENLLDVIEEIQHAIKVTESSFKDSTAFAKKCGKPLCRYCERLGYAKATFAKTKLLFDDMINRLKHDHSPRVIFDKHIREGYGNYQAWILPNGHYINVWKVGGHSLFARICENKHGDYSRVKVHAQGERSDIIFYSPTTHPTNEQIETIGDIITDSIMWEYRLTFCFSYDAHHPDPKLLDEIPF